MRQLYISAAFVCFHLSSRSARSVLKINRLVTRIFISHISSTLGFVAPYLVAGNDLINIIEFFSVGNQISVILDTVWHLPDGPPCHLWCFGTS